MYIFIICGYGIPEDIASDQNYSTYLRIAFNFIYALAGNKQAAIIPCGGPTNCNPPYNGTEAEAIADHIQQLMKRDSVSYATQEWSLYPENTSLSSLENLLFAKRVMETHRLAGRIAILCEQTRKDKMTEFSKIIFHKVDVQVIPIDFDVSANRYLDPQVIKEKEQMGIREGLWTLEDPERLKRHHEFFEKKFEFLRQLQREGMTHVEAVSEWFKNEKQVIQQLMPDHPLLKALEDQQ